MAQGVMAEGNSQVYCSKCRKTMASTNFYTYKDGSKCELCKSCLTMHINNFDESTYLWLLEKFDLPYLPWEWNVLRDRAYQKDPYKMNGMSVFGKYLSKMKLKQYVDPVTKKSYGWADSSMLQEKHDAQAKLYGQPEEIAMQQMAEMEEAYRNGEITEAQWMTYKELKAPEPEFQVINGTTITTAGPGGGVYPVNDNPFEKVDVPDVGNDLTEEDKIYLAMKWGRLYSASDWVYLEQKYNDFMNSFDIQGAARIDTLIQICKLSLKMNQALDTGDYDTYAKLSRAYDTMMKSAKFTEAQNKDGDSNEFDSVGAIVAFCEKEGGFIPEYQIDAPRDIIDTIIDDNKTYLQTLIHNDTNLSQQIEQFLKKKEIAEEQKRDRQKAKEEGKDVVEISDKDYADFYAAVQSDVEQDAFITITNENEEEE